MAEAPDDEKFAYRAKQGRPAPFVEIRARNEDGLVPWDAQTMGELEVRGPWIASAYYNRADSADRFTDDGWFRTGDIVTIDGDATIQVQDRIKDLIKSGGEWISSVALECALMGHPAVAEAAVIPVASAKWSERPLAAVVLKPGATATPAELQGVPRAAVREVLAARRLRVHRRDPADVGRQVQEERAARAVQGLPGRRVIRPGAGVGARLRCQAQHRARLQCQAPVPGPVPGSRPGSECQAPVPGSSARLRCQAPGPGSSARLRGRSRGSTRSNGEKSEDRRAPPRLNP